MKNSKSSSSTTTTKPKSNAVSVVDKDLVTSPQLNKLFEDGLKDIFGAEKSLIKALGKMKKNAGSKELVAAIDTHISQTEEQVSRLEEVFSILGKEPRAKKCEAMEGLIKEGETIMEAAEEGPMRDACIIAAAQKVEHYEISSYSTLSTYAETLGLDEAVVLLDETLEEEKDTDTLLSDLATTSVNLMAVSESKE